MDDNWQLVNRERVARVAAYFSLMLFVVARGLREDRVVVAPRLRLRGAPANEEQPRQRALFKEEGRSLVRVLPPTLLPPSPARSHVLSSPPAAEVQNRRRLL